MGTLGVSRYLRVVASVRRLVERAGKKAYTLVVGKLNPAKLANFAEVSRQFVFGFWGGGRLRCIYAYGFLNSNST